MQTRGFSLLEILVAFSILAISLAVLMRIFSGSLNHATISRDQTEATQFAQSLLAAAGREAALSAGEQQGRHGDRFRWQLSIQPAEDIGSNTAGWRLPAELWQLTAEVAWGGDAGDKARSVVLSTLRVQVRRP